MREETALVDDLTGVRLPPMARLRLRRARRRRRTGIVLAAAINKSPRAVSKYDCSVVVRAGGQALCRCSSVSPAAKFVAVAPGQHRLEFWVVRMSSDSSVERDVRLAAGEVLVAYCRPKNKRSMFDRDPPPDHWYIGVV